MSEIISVVSGKGGVGKTTFSINFAAALKEFGKEVIVVDADTYNPNVGLRLGLPTLAVSLQDVLNGEVKVHHSVFMHPTGLKVIPASVSFDKMGSNLSKLRDVLLELEGTVIIDSPPGLNDDVKAIIKASDIVFVITNPEHAAVIDAIKTIKLAKSLGKNRIYVIVNRVTGDAYELTTDEIELLCETPVLASISEDQNIRKANFENIPVIYRNPYSKASIDLRFLISRLFGIEYKPPPFLFLRRLFDR